MARWAMSMQHNDSLQVLLLLLWVLSIRSSKLQVYEMLLSLHTGW
jgi:hypothetical protein